jgi:hypothetical protein
MPAMLVFIAATVGMCALIITWALGLNSDVGGLIALGFVGIGILAQMATRGSSSEPGR